MKQEQDEMTSERKELKEERNALERWVAIPRIVVDYIILTLSGP